MLDPATSTPPSLEISASRQFTAWLAEQRVSLAFTTYQVGKLFFLGLKPTGQLSVFERTFERCMGLWADGSTLYMSSLYQIWRFENVLKPGELHQGYDALFVPQMSYVTGDLDVHDLALASDGHGGQRLIFINTLFSCLATVSETHSFQPLWTPPFISRLAAEDRCHLNGLAMDQQHPRFVTAVSCSDVGDGWRDRRRDGGVVIDLMNQRIALKGLSMPHSPRWYDDRLWLLNSGTGFFGYADFEQERFVPVTFCPGYTRGLALQGHFAIIGLSLPRHNKTFSGLDLDDNLRSRDAEPRCGLAVIDLRTGDLVHWVRIEGTIEEIYDVVVLPGIQRPMALGFRTDEIRRTITIAPDPGTIAPPLESMSLETRLAQGLQQQQQQDYQAARITYEQILQTHPNEIATLINLGTVHQALGDWSAAIACYQGVIAQQPSRIEAWYNLGSLWHSKARQAMSQGDPTEATRLRQDAIHCFDQVIEINPEMDKAYFKLGQLYKEADCLEAAVSHYRQAIVLCPTDAQAHTNLGNLLGELGQFDKAIVLHQQAITLQPRFAEAHYNLGNVYRTTERLEDAVAAYQQALEYHPEFRAAEINLAVTLNQLECKDESARGHS